MNNSLKPGPASYEPTDCVHRKPKSQVSAKAIRMKKDRYDTDAPGVGSYRYQSEFGIYSASDTFN